MTKAVLLLWFSLIAGVVKTAMDFNVAGTAAKPALTYFMLAATFILVAFLITQIFEGKNWARTTFLVMFLIGMMPTLTLVAGEFAQSTLAGGVTVLQLILQIRALILLYTQPGSGWFSRDTSPPRE